MNVFCRNDYIGQLERLLYSKLQVKGKLSFEEVINIFDSKEEYGFRRVQGEAINRIRDKYGVIQLQDERGRPYLKIM